MMIIDSRYKVLESLGTGLWATVYKVEDIRTQKIYALKLYQQIEADELYKKFPPEAMHHITQIEHPNLVQVIDFGNVDNHIYNLSEFYEGNPLKYFRYKTANLQTLYDIIVQICYGIHALHAHNIIHKDLKPDNILYRMIGSVPEVKILDFGFTKVDLQKDLHQVSGALPYISPEIYLGKQAVPQSDFYSLGVTLYRLTTGTFPFSLDQISALIAGNQQHFFPKFPRELNPDIPPSLERLILRLLEKNPEDRFQDVGQIISFINRTQLKEYAFSLQWTIVNTLRFNSYIVRKDYSHQLLDYLPNVEQSNGKLISLIGGEGLGKDNLLSLFRYHLLNGRYFLFDYTCSKTNRDPFFALIREFHHSMFQDDSRFRYDLSNISEKFKRYIFESEAKAGQVDIRPEDLQVDFESARSYLAHLSEERPLVFIIREARFLTPQTLEFLNFCSQEMSRWKIFIVLSFNNYDTAKELRYSVTLKVQPLSLQEATDYTQRLVHQTVPKQFVFQLWYRSAGNPVFLRDILNDLTQKKLIWQNEKFTFKYNFENYQLPSRLLTSINSRLEHLTSKAYEYLQYVAIISTPLTKDLLLSVLAISEKDLFFLINESVNNEILTRKHEELFFTFPEARQRLLSETTEDIHKQVSDAVLRYFDNTRVTGIDVCRGIIVNANIAEDWVSVRRYTLQLVALLNDASRQNEAFDQMIKVLDIDLTHIEDISKTDLITDMTLFQAKMEMAGDPQTALDALKKHKQIPEIFEKHMLLATIKLALGDLNQAITELKKALQQSITGKQEIKVKLLLITIYIRLGNRKNVKAILQELESVELPLELQIGYIDKKALFCANNGNITEAIEILEQFIQHLPAVQDQACLIRLASIHNNLGTYYSDQKIIEEAYEHYQQARKIWERFDYENNLGLIYNNIGDVFLKQGDTITAQQHFQTALEHSSKYNTTAARIQSQLNLGETYIKLGDFELAENFLLEAKATSEANANQRFYDAIIQNLALAKSKIKNFFTYYQFIQEVEPAVIEGKINKLTPLVKTYFYYLFETGNVEKISRLFTKNAHIDFNSEHEEEFYHNVLSNLAELQGDYSAFMRNVEIGMEYATRNKNQYAQTIFYVQKAKGLLSTNELDAAREMISRANKIAEKYQYRYWIHSLKLLQCRADLLDPKLPLRFILRNLIELLGKLIQFDYFLLELDTLSIIGQLYGELNSEHHGKAYLERYKSRLIELTKGLDEEDKNSILNGRHYYAMRPTELNATTIARRIKPTKEYWNENLYDMLRMNKTEQISYFIEKTLLQMLAPHQYAILLVRNNMPNFEIFASKNVETESYLQVDYISHINKSMEEDSIENVLIHGNHTLFIPLRIKSSKIGCLVLNDMGELEFSRLELSLVKTVRMHLTNILLRIREVTAMNSKMDLMNKLMEYSQHFLSILDIDKLELELVSSAIDFVNASRGFLIKRDSYGNYSLQIGMDNQKHLLSQFTMISKTALVEVTSTNHPIVTNNAKEDNLFRNSISVQDYTLHAIYCAPILVDGEMYALLYLDNYLDNKRGLVIQTELMNLFIMQMSVAIKKSLQYSLVIQKNMELHALDVLKDDFSAIVSHELNTPLTTLQSYVSKLKRNVFADDNDRNETLTKVERSVKKLIMTTSDIVTMTKFNIATSLPKSPVNIEEILQLIQHETEIISHSRNMQIKLRVESDLPLVEMNWEAVHLMIYNVVLNAIRFTADFGTIVIGARRSAFQQEKLNGQDALVLYVQDNGIGIPEQELENVFKKYYELNDIYSHRSGTVEYRSSGLGLGLSTCKRIIDLHNGAIWIKSKEHEGTNVFMVIPFKDAGVALTPTTKLS